MHSKTIFSCLFILLNVFIYKGIASSKTVFKASMETGITDLDIFGSGISDHFQAKIDGNQVFKSSLLKYKLSTNAQFFDTDSSINGAKLSGEFNYTILLDKKISFNFFLHNSNNLYKVMGNNTQQLLYILAGISGNYQLSKKSILELAAQNSYNRIGYQKGKKLIINTISSAIILKSILLGNLKAGFFFDNLHYNDFDTTSQKDRVGIRTEFSYRKKIIFGLAVSLAKYMENNIYNTQFNIIAGKYLWGDLSLFFYGNIVRVLGDDIMNQNIIVINRLESLKNLSVKLAYDLDSKTTAYLKYLYEDHNLQGNITLIESRQLNLGIQLKFP